MAAVQDISVDTETPERKRQARDGGKANGKPAKRLRGVSGLDTAPLSTVRNPAERKALLSLYGKQKASSLGAVLVRQILARSGLSMRQLERKSGFDVGLLSRIANGKRPSGPELWTLIALAEAVGLELTIDLTQP
ncbi:MAG: helix-turn-helix transcriptional regulator [Devosiaceae bacterium]|nr:helix-turn-helix transcriptional regulator [Devosiaceae bacterium MH13]